MPECSNECSNNLRNLQNVSELPPPTSDKFRTAPRARVLGILRHEMGHVVDFATKRDARALDAWALTYALE